MSRTQAEVAPVDLSVVVPAYNEAANVEPVVAEILATLRDSPWVGSYEVLLVDDGSRDGTGAIMARLAAADPALRVLRHETNRGFGAALRTGFAHTRGRVVTYITADGEIGADQALRLAREMGDRDLLLSGRARRVGAGRGLLTWGVNWTSRLILGFWPEETVGSYVVRGDVLRSLPLHSSTGLVNLEIILHCRRAGRRIGRSGVTEARPRLSGASKVTNLRTIVKTLWEMLALRWRLARTGVPAGGTR